MRATGETRELVRRARARRRRRGHPDAGAGPRRRARGRARGDAHPPRRPAHRAAVGRRTRSARGCRERRLGRGVGRCSTRSIGRGLEQGRRELDETRRRLGPAAVGRVHGGISRPAGARRDLPAARVPARRAPPATHVVGPLLWEPRPATSSSRRATGRSCSSRLDAQDRAHRLLRAALAGLGDAAACACSRPGTGAAARRRRSDRAAPTRGSSSGSATRATMPRCDVVVCHGGHGTLVRALASGCAVVVAPAAGDMNENAARVDWAGAGVRIPRRLCAPGPCAWRSSGRSASRACARARASSRRGGERTTRRRGRPSWSRTSPRAAPAPSRGSRRPLSERAPRRGAARRRPRGRAAPLRLRGPGPPVRPPPRARPGRGGAAPSCTERGFVRHTN